MTNGQSRGYSPLRIKASTIRPLTIYAAATDKFEVCAPSHLSANDVRKALFDDLPLAEHNWSTMNAVLTKLTTRPCGQHWMLSREREKTR